MAARLGCISWQQTCLGLENLATTPDHRANVRLYPQVGAGPSPTGPIPHTEFPLSWLQKFSGFLQDPRSIFPGPCRMPVMFKYKDKQQLLRGPGRSPCC